MFLIPAFSFAERFTSTVDLPAKERKIREAVADHLAHSGAVCLFFMGSFTAAGRSEEAFRLLVR